MPHVYVDALRLISTQLDSTMHTVHCPSAQTCRCGVLDAIQLDFGNTRNVEDVHALMLR
jgi:hypothetical protein